MKRTIYLCVWIVIAIAATSCNKQPGDRFSGPEMSNPNGASLLATCPPINLSGTISTPTTLTTGNTYLLQGTVVVDNTTLTIQPGVIIFGEKSSNGALVVKPNASINAAGTSSSPIVFTSDQAVSARAPGDWAGVFLLGNAPNNQSNSLAVRMNGTNYTAGGSTAASSIGTLQYVQIHYAGAGGGTGADRRSEGALVIASAGSASTIDHIQISNSGLDGLGVWGGSPTIKYVFEHAVQRTDFLFSYGSTAKAQFLAGQKKDVISPVSLSYGMEISNVFPGESSSATPLTYPTMSNISLLGPTFCGTATTTNYQDAITIYENGDARIFNSYITDYPRNGLFLEGDEVVENTATGATELQFSYNTTGTFAAADYDFQASAAWNSLAGCQTGLIATMQSWIEGQGTGACREFDNEFGISVGSNASFCSNYCGGSFTPNFTFTTSDMQDPNFVDWTSTGFTTVSYRGAFDPSTSWVSNTWADLCPQSTNYCL